jgi:uncharacterized membrane protein YccC
MYLSKLTVKSVVTAIGATVLVVCLLFFTPARQELLATTDLLDTLVGAISMWALNWLWGLAVDMTRHLWEPPIRRLEHAIGMEIKSALVIGFLATLVWLFVAVGVFAFFYQQPAIVGVAAVCVGILSSGLWMQVQRTWKEYSDAASRANGPVDGIGGALRR